MQTTSSFLRNQSRMGRNAANRMSYIDQYPEGVKTPEQLVMEMNQSPNGKPQAALRQQDMKLFDNVPAMTLPCSSPRDTITVLSGSQVAEISLDRSNSRERDDYSVDQTLQNLQHMFIKQTKMTQKQEIKQEKAKFMRVARKKILSMQRFMDPKRRELILKLLGEDFDK